jgi:hypothetical protein
MSPGRERGQAGFILTMEMILIFTILGIGLLVGIVAIRNALFKLYVTRQAHAVYVYDSDDPPKRLARVRDFDEHEAPRLFYNDRGVEWPAGGGELHNFRAMIGVRDDRFTSRHRIFYKGEGCTGDPCIAGASVEASDNEGVGFVQDSDGTDELTRSIQEAGGMGYLYALQRIGEPGGVAGPSYGIGRDVDEPISGLPGTLYRQTATTCSAGDIQSRWTSQRVTAAEPCEPFVGETDGFKCPSAAGQCTPAASSLCVVSGGTCSCPAGYIDDGSANCCPDGSTHAAPGRCRLADLFEAEAVENASGVNALSVFVPPFRVNLPPDPSEWVSVPPSGEAPPP